MHYAFLASIIAAALLGAAAMSVVHAAEAPAISQAVPPPPEITNTGAAGPPMKLLPVDVSTESSSDRNRPHRDSYYGQGFESRGINIDNLPRGGPGYGHRPASH